MCDNIKTAAIVLAGGKGSRMGSDTPKQYIELNGYPIIYYSLKVFEESCVDEIVLVCQSGDEEYCRENIVNKYDFTKVSHIVAGGKERYNSVANGLFALSDCDIVFIHDGARPFVTNQIIEDALKETIATKATVVAVPSKDTVKLADEDGYGDVTPDRNKVWIVQTPQTFDYRMIRDAYKTLIDSEDAIKAKGINITDDAMVMEHLGNTKAKFVMGDYKNIKVTTPEDLIIAKAYLQ